jgi:hypothetical protein
MIVLTGSPALRMRRASCSRRGRRRMARNAVRTCKEVRLARTRLWTALGLFGDKLVGPEREAGEAAH